jgi:hypothetical protein
MAVVLLSLYSYDNYLTKHSIYFGGQLPRKTPDFTVRWLKHRSHHGISQGYEGGIF